MLFVNNIKEFYDLVFYRCIKIENKDDLSHW